jgi:subtilase family serine protease
VFTKPSWQAGLNVPDDGARDVPDISMGAAGGAPGFFVYSREAGTRVASLVATGGTSIASPMWAAISRLVAQSQGVTRLGNINPRLYELGNQQSPTSGLHDITSGNNDDGAIPGYGAALGDDQVTGWGTPNIALLVAAFPGAALSAKETSIKLARGRSAETGSFSVANTTTDPLQLNSVILDVTSSKLLASVQLSATVGGVTQGNRNAGKTNRFPLSISARDSQLSNSGNYADRDCGKNPRPFISIGSAGFNSCQRWPGGNHPGDRAACNSDSCEGAIT